MATIWVPGKLCCRSARNGMVPPSPMAPGVRPKRPARPGRDEAVPSSRAAPPALAAASRSMVRWAPSSVVMAEIRASAATWRRRRAAGAARTWPWCTAAGRCRRRGGGQAVGAGHLERRRPRARDQPVGRVRRQQSSPSTTGAASSGNSCATARREARCASGIPAPRSSGRTMRRSPRPRCRTGCDAGSGTTTAPRRRPAPLWTPSVRTSHARWPRGCPAATTSATGGRS